MDRTSVVGCDQYQSSETDIKDIIVVYLLKSDDLGESFYYEILLQKEEKKSRASVCFHSMKKIFVNLNNFPFAEYFGHIEVIIDVIDVVILTWSVEI